MLSLPSRTIERALAVSELGVIVLVLKFSSLKILLLANKLGFITAPISDFSNELCS